MRHLLRRLSPLPQSRTEVVLMGTIALCLAALLLAGCQAGWLPATRDYAQEVAADNAESAAAGNPLSAIIQSIATLGLALSGGIFATKRAVQKYDAKPFAGADGREVTEARVVAAVEKIEGSTKSTG